MSHKTNAELLVLLLAGIATPGLAAGTVNCDDQNPCTVDLCGLRGTCRHIVVPDGTSCDDGKTCTEGDVCTAGVCQGQAVCPASADGCRLAGPCVESTCELCELAHIQSGDCSEELMGCSKILTGAADIALCEVTLTCMRATGCWKRDPLECLCGTARDSACLTPAANGACKAEIIAAAHATNAADAGARFFDTSFPVNYAMAVISCDLEFCSPMSTPASNACQ